jgi:hypothetical protein
MIRIERRAVDAKRTRLMIEFGRVMSTTSHTSDTQRARVYSGLLTTLYISILRTGTSGASYGRREAMGLF